MQGHMSTCAAIDIGSNTIHIVVARCSPRDLEIMADEVELVRIGESVTATGEISAQKRDAAIAVLQKYKALAQQHAANPVLVVATEAIRQAKNSDTFLEDVQRSTGLEVQLIDGNVEATLTFHGATYELTKEADAPAQIGVMDLGGGSTELVLAKHEQITWRTSVPVGSGWLHDRYLPSDPPTREELAVGRIFLQTYFQGLHMKRGLSALIATGGSANSLLRLAHHAFGLDLQASRLSHDDLVRSEGLLSALPAAEIAQRYQQPPGRVQILPAGALILRVAMERLGLDEVRVSPHGIREGVLLAYARYGAQWLARTKQNVVQGEAQGSKEQSEDFAHSGRRLVLERTHKLLEWRDDVLKQDDIEAVHKMRVASRRLRAVLDAYESMCDPKQFKGLYRRIKQIADVLGKARDTDVMIDNLEAQLEHVPSDEQAGLHWMIRQLRSYRNEHQRAVEAFLKKLDEGDFKKQVDAVFSEERTNHGKSQANRRTR